MNSYEAEIKVKLSYDFYKIDNRIYLLGKFTF